MSQRKKEKFQMFASCPVGLESLLFQEMKDLKFSKSEQQVGGVKFEGTWQDLYLANLQLTTAIRVFLQILRFPCDSIEEFAISASKLSWQKYMNLQTSFAISSKVNHPKIKNSHYVSQRLKDVIVDFWREKKGNRPNVDLKKPQVKFHVWISKKSCTISLDSSLVSLHQRGYRKELVEAPLSEALASAIIRQSGWNGHAPLIDPMCGSGTFLIEGALKARGIFPGTLGRSYGFETWPSFQKKLFHTCKEKLLIPQKTSKLPTLLGFDKDRQAIEVAKVNSQVAKVAENIQFQQMDIGHLELKKGWNGWILCNPPYGERLDHKRFMVPLYQKLGKFLKTCPRYKAFILSGFAKAEESIGLQANSSISLKNGGLDCQLLGYEL